MTFPVVNGRARPTRPRVSASSRTEPIDRSAGQAEAGIGSGSHVGPDAETRHLHGGGVVGAGRGSRVRRLGDPRSTRTTTVSPWTTAPQSTTPSPTKEPVLSGPTVVAARQLSDDSRVLVAYDLDDGTTRELATLQREDHPAVDATGTAVVVEQYTGPPDAALQSWRETGTGSHLVLIDLTTGARRELTAEHSGVFDRQPAWNRSGDGWVYFLREQPPPVATPDLRQREGASRNTALRYPTRAYQTDHAST